MTPATAPHPATAFWDKTAPKYAAKPVADPAAYHEKLQRIRALLRTTDTVLEIGCGTGSTALHLAPHVANYTATDISPAMIEIADRKRRAAGTQGLHCVSADADAPRPEAPFDVVMAFSLLHLVPDLEATLGRVFEQLRPGGLFLSKTVCLGDANLGIRLLVRTLKMIGIAPPILFVSAVDLRKALMDAGFEIVEQRYFGKGRFNPFIVARRAD